MNAFSPLQALPRIPIPVYSLAMKGCVVSCTSMAKEIRVSEHTVLLSILFCLLRNLHKKYMSETITRRKGVPVVSINYVLILYSLVTLVVF